MSEQVSNNPNSALAIVTQAENSLEHLIQLGRNATPPDVLRRKNLAEALTRVPDSYVFVDGTGSMTNDEAAAKKNLECNDIRIAKC